MKKTYIKLVSVSAVIVALVIAVSCLTTNNDVSISDKPTNVILFIGDGMGVAQVTSAITVAGAPLHIESMPVTGLSKTSSHDRYVTDSAAGGTAIATGVKTRNGMIGMGPDSTAVETIVEIAGRNGLSTGLISTSSITHATPASFIAHVASRNSNEEIATYFTNGILDVFFGGGLDYFINRSDSVNLVDKLRSEGYSVALTAEELNEIKSGKVAGLFSAGHMPKASEGRPVSLAEMTRKAIELLSKNDKGFFLMVEGSMIDWAGHDSDTEYSNLETLDLDAAIGEAIAFATANENTLVIVTADHETGGMALTGGSLENRVVQAKWPTTGHTATMVPVFSCGSGADKFAGIMENTELFERIVMALEIK